MEKEVFIRKYLGFSDTGTVRNISECLQEKTLLKGEMLSEPGRVITALPLLIEGAIMCYTYGEKGKRAVDCIAAQPGMALAPDFEWVRGKPSTMWMKVLSETNVYLLEMEDLAELKKKYPGEIDRTFLMYTQKSFDMHFRHKTALLMSSRKRIEWFEKYYGNVHIRTEDAASFLNMTRENYSKVRKQIAEGCKGEKCSDR